MPTYEFRCPNGHDFDRFYKTISGAPSEVDCPECGAIASRRLSGGAGFLFKGSGFYLTDYGKNAHRKAAPDAKAGDTKAGDTKSSDAKAPGSGESGGGGKTESAPKAESSKESKPDGSPKSESTKPKPSTKPKTE